MAPFWCVQEDVVASEHSFDVVSKIDLQEVDNAVQQAAKEIGQRYDFRGSSAGIRREAHALVLQAEDEYRLKAVVDILAGRLASRKVPLKGLTFDKPQAASGGSVRQEVQLQQGIPLEHAKEIVKVLKSAKLKVQVAIQGDQVRVRGKNRDDLQAAIRILKDRDLPIDMQYTNYR
ncbi:MAG: YajQ family cyclic di-GMP-binding protein [Acidobacteria bacterium]|nr:YajQ family cyclic di-GMP-binding protein [Acidobacteriota bacterium]